MSQGFNSDLGKSISSGAASPHPYQPSVPDCDSMVKIEDEPPTSENTNAWDEFENLKLIYNPPNYHEARQSKESTLRTPPHNGDSSGKRLYDSSESYIGSALNCDIVESYNMDKLVSSYEDYRSEIVIESMHVPSYPPNVPSITHGSELQGSPTLSLEDSDLWDKFRSQQNEMIITKSGRCLFPCLRFRAANLDPVALYTLRIDLELMDPRRFRFSNGVWTPVDRSTQVNDSSDEDSTASTILSREYYVHPSLCKDGSYWMDAPISFSKIKLSNKFPDSSNDNLKITHTNDDVSSHIFHVLSFHMYRPRVSLIERSRGSQAVVSSKCFTFDQTNFIAVTHYQNHRVNDLKKGFNPHAKGFRKKMDQATPDHDRYPQFHRLQKRSISSSLNPPNRLRYKRNRRIKRGSTVCDDDSESDSDHEDKNFAKGNLELTTSKKKHTFGSGDRTRMSKPGITRSLNPSATIRMDDSNSIATITITNRVARKKYLYSPLECASSSAQIINCYEKESLATEDKIQIFDSNWPRSDSHDHLDSLDRATVDNQKRECITWYNQIPSLCQPSIYSPNSFYDTAQENLTTTNWPIPKSTASGTNSADPSSSFSYIISQRDYTASSYTMSQQAPDLGSNTTTSRSLVTPPLPLLEFPDQMLLKRTLLENSCLKAFIREKYGSEAEADANAVVAMQFYN